MKLFQDSNGDTSSMRVMAFICIITGCLIGLLAVLMGRDLSGAGVLIGAILAPAFIGKAYQAKEELKSE